MNKQVQMCVGNFHVCRVIVHGYDEWWEQTNAVHVHV